MIYWELFAAFLKIGLFSFGGAYAAVPLIQDVVLSHGWMDTAMFTNVVAISEATPGPIMVNMATYVGAIQGGVPGAMLATLGVVLPAFVIILLVAAFLRSWLQSSGVRAVLRGVKPCLMGVILATGVWMLFGELLGSVTAPSPDAGAAVILVILLVLPRLYTAKTKKPFSPILLIALAALCGVVVYGRFPPLA